MAVEQNVILAALAALVVGGALGAGVSSAVHDDGAGDRGCRTVQRHHGEARFDHGTAARPGAGPRRGAVVSGADLARLRAAVKAADAAVSVDRAWRIVDGSYRAAGAKGGARVEVAISKDLKTVTVDAAARDRRGAGAPAGSPDGWSAERKAGDSNPREG